MPCNYPLKELKKRCRQKDKTNWLGLGKPHRNIGHKAIEECEDLITGEWVRESLLLRRLKALHLV